MVWAKYDSRLNKAIKYDFFLLLEGIEMPIIVSKMCHIQNYDTLRRSIAKYSTATTADYKVANGGKPSHDTHILYGL